MAALMLCELEEVADGRYCVVPALHRAVRAATAAPSAGSSPGIVSVWLLNTCAPPRRGYRQKLCHGGLYTIIQLLT
jgi:hypothetical protein